MEFSRKIPELPAVPTLPALPLLPISYKGAVWGPGAPVKNRRPALFVKCRPGLSVWVAAQWLQWDTIIIVSHWWLWNTANFVDHPLWKVKKKKKKNPDWILQESCSNRAQIFFLWPNPAIFGHKNYTIIKFTFQPFRVSSVFINGCLDVWMFNIVYVVVRIVCSWLPLRWTYVEEILIQKNRDQQQQVTFLMTRVLELQEEQEVDK